MKKMLAQIRELKAVLNCTWKSEGLTYEEYLEIYRNLYGVEVALNNREAPKQAKRDPAKKMEVSKCSQSNS
jgi:hypothetical protein